MNIASLNHIVSNYPYVSHIYVYSSPKIDIINFSNPSENHFPLVLGHIYFIDYDFNDGACCGIINQDYLDYSSIHLHNKLHTRNGCLDRKISVDRFWNIKNCPSMKNSYGKVGEISIREVITKDSFKSFGFINKDSISICKMCEFRYNCTDCRAFITDESDIYSKPLKCGYNPYTCTWEDWSLNPLKHKEDILNQ
jgi:SPASM domain peptide maturase of grasp-with-spasm system